LAEHQAVGQSGELVVGGQKLRARLGLLALRHILKDHHDPAIRHRLMGQRDDPTIRQWTFQVADDAAGQPGLNFGHHLGDGPVRMIAAGGTQLDHLPHGDAR